MNSLTYGTLPEFAKFEKHFHKALVADGVFNGMYRILLNDSDARMSEQLDLGIGRLYDCESLYALCEALVAVHNIERVELTGSDSFWHNNNADWAGDFCSAIMTTLEFEWV